MTLLDYGRLEKDGELKISKIGEARAPNRWFLKFSDFKTSFFNPFLTSKALKILFLFENLLFYSTYVRLKENRRYE